MRHVTTLYLAILTMCSDTHTCGTQARAASTSLSCPDFSVFFEADLTLLLADPAKGGQKAGEISHVFQSFDYGVKLVHS